MKKKIILLLIIVATAISSFLIGKLSTPTPEEKDYISCDSVVDWQITENGLEITLSDGNVYTWGK